MIFRTSEVGGSGSEFLFAPTLNKRWDLSFLEQIANQECEAIHVVIEDGARFYHKISRG